VNERISVNTEMTLAFSETVRKMADSSLKRRRL